jgi:hypothetical protein
MIADGTGDLDDMQEDQFNGTDDELRALWVPMDEATLPEMEYRRWCNWRFRRLLRAAKIRQVDLANRLGYDRARINHWSVYEGREVYHTIRSHDLYLFSRKFNVPGAADWIYLGDPGNLPVRIARALEEETLKSLEDALAEPEEKDGPTAALAHPAPEKS